MNLDTVRRTRSYQNLGMAGLAVLPIMIMLLYAMPDTIRAVAPGLGGLLIFIPFMLFLIVVSVSLVAVFCIMTYSALTAAKNQQNLVPYQNFISDIGYIMYAITIIITTVKMLEIFGVPTVFSTFIFIILAIVLCIMMSYTYVGEKRQQKLVPYHDFMLKIGYIIIPIVVILTPIRFPLFDGESGFKHLILLIIAVIISAILLKVLPPLIKK